MVHNLLWGVFSGLWVGAGVSAVVLVIGLFNPEARADAAGIGGFFALLVAYAAAAIVCGVTVGLLRFLARSRYGVRLLGAILTAEAFAAFLTITLGTDFFDAATILVFLVMALVAGWLFAPLWHDGIRSGMLWIPDFDRRIAALRHTTTVGNPRDPDGPGAA